MGTELERSGGLEHLRRAETPLEVRDPELVEQKAREEEVITDSTRSDLQHLKDRIEAGDVDDSLVGALLDEVNDLPPEKHQEKPVILGMLLTSLHQKGIRFGGFKKGGITLIPDTSEEAQKYEVYLNGALKKGTFQKSDFQKALLYSTSEMQAYLPEMDENPSIGSYVVSLLNKYQIEYKGVTVSKSGETKIPKPSESSYATFRDFLEHRISDRADSDFLVAYFDDVFYKDGAGFSGKYLSDYKKMVGENQGELATAFRDLNHEQRQVMGVITPADVHEKTKKYAADPKQFFIDSLQGGGVHAGIVFGIIGAIFFGKKGFIGGLLMGLIGGVVSPAEAGNFIAGMFDTKQKPAFKKYRDQILEKRNGLDKDKTEMTYTALMQNEKFQVKSAKNIYIFEKTSLEQKEFFESCGIWLNDENTPILKHIFTRIITSRKADGIEPRDEQMKEYLNRKPEKMATSQASTGETSATTGEGTSQTDAKVAAGVAGATVAGAGAPTATPQGVMGNVGNMSVTGGEIITEKEGQILEYFAFSPEDKLKVNAFFDRLKSRGIDLSLERFLGAYKDYIETNVHTLYQASLREATKRRVLDTINGVNLEEMEKAEIDNYGTLREFGQNKRIIDTKFDDKFSDFDTQVLPTASLLKQLLDANGNLKPGIQLSTEQQEKLKLAKEMFASELLSDGRFNNSDWIPSSFGNTFGAIQNTWDVFEAGELVGSQRALEVPERGLLNPEDQGLKTRVTVSTMIIYALLAGNDVASFCPGWTVPGATIGMVYDGIDVVSDEELAVTILRKTHMLPDDYRTDKNWWDRILAGVSIIPGVTALTRGTKRTLNPKEMKEAMEFQNQLRKILPGFKDRIITSSDEVVDLQRRIPDYEHATREVVGAKTKVTTGTTEVARIQNEITTLDKVFQDARVYLHKTWFANGLNINIPNHAPQDIQGLVGKSDFVDAHLSDLFNQARIPEIGPHSPQQLQEIQRIYTQIASDFDVKLGEDMTKVKDIIDNLWTQKLLPQVGPFSPEQMQKIEEIFSQVTPEIAEKFPDLLPHLFPNAGEVLQLAGYTTKKTGLEASLLATQNTLSQDQHILKNYEDLIASGDPKVALQAERQRLEAMQYWGDRGWIRHTDQVENMKHMFDELLSSGSDVEVAGMKFSRVQGGYACKDSLTGVEHGPFSTFLEMISNKDVHLNPMEVFNKFSKQKLAQDPKLLTKINEKLMKGETVDVDFGGSKHKYSFQIDPANQEIKVYRKQGKTDIPVIDAREVDVVMESFRGNRLPAIVERMHQRFMNTSLDTSLNESTLKKMWETLKKAGSSTSSGVSSGFTMTFSAFKKLHWQDVPKVLPPIIGNSKEIFSSQFKTVTKNVLIGNTTLAIAMSTGESGYDAYNGNETNFILDTVDRFIAYNLVGVLFGELWNQGSEPLGDLTALATGN